MSVAGVAGHTFRPQPVGWPRSKRGVAGHDGGMGGSAATLAALTAHRAERVERNRLAATAPSTFGVNP